MCFITNYTFLNINSTSELVINFKNKNLSIQSINTVHLKFNINNVINTLTFKNAFYMLLIIYNIMIIKPLRIKDFSVTIQKNDSVLHKPNGTKLAILNTKH